MDPKSTPEQSVISDERASLQRAVILSCWKLTIIGRLGPQKLRLGPEKLPVGPCPFRSGDFSASRVATFQLRVGTLLARLGVSKRRLGPTQGRLGPTGGDSRGRIGARARGPLARPRVGAREADTRRRGGWGLGAARLHYPLGEAPGPGPTRRREWERATTATTSGSALGPLPIQLSCQL